VRPELGLRDEVSDLIVLAWAALRQRAWYQHGAAIAAPKPGQVKAEMELRTEPLPTPEDYRLAVTRAGALFGLVANPYLTAPAVAELTERLRTDVASRVDAASGLAPKVEALYGRLGLDTASATGRLATARDVAALLGRLRTAGDRVKLVEALAHAQLSVSDAAAAKSLSSAVTVGESLHGFRWERLSPLLEAERAEGDRGREAKAIVDALRRAVLADEMTTGVRGALDAGMEGVFAWLAAATPPPPPPPPRKPDDVFLVLPEGSPKQPVLDQLAAFLDAHAHQQVVVEWRVQE